MVLKENYVNGETLTATAFNELADQVNTNTDQLSAASNANTASTLVRRDASGNFSAGTVTASRLVSTVATGTAPLTVTSTTVVPNLNANFVAGASTATTGTANSVAQRDASGNLTANVLTSTVAQGTAPMTVTSTTMVSNLNAQLLNGIGQTVNATASTIAARDANANLNADNFINSVDSVATAATTTTLTMASGGVQVFTGTTTQTVVLPSGASVLAGVQFTIINQSTAGAITVQYPAGTLLVSVPVGFSGEFTALTSNPTLVTHWRAVLFAQTSGVMATTSNTLAAFTQSTTNAIGVGTIELGHASDTTLSRSAAGTLAVEGVDVVTTTGTQAISGKTSVTSTGAVTGSTLVSTVAQGTAPLTVTSNTNIPNLNASLLSNLGANGGALVNSIAARDANANLLARGFIPGFTTTVASTTTVVLTCSAVASTTNQIQEFTGTSTQTVTLPTANVVAGQSWTIINNSSGAVTVQSSAAAAIGAALTTGTSAQFIALVATPTAAANWHRR